MKSLNDGGEIRPKQGPKFKVPLQDEEQLVKSINEHAEQGDPRTEEDVASEICHFLKCYGYENTFKKQKPGSCYCENYSISCTFIYSVLFIAQ